MAERGQVSNFSPKNSNHISFLPSAMILRCSEGMYVTYTSEIFPYPRSKKQVFVEQCLGRFLAELGLFCHFVPGLLGIVLGTELLLSLG